MLKEIFSKKYNGFEALSDVDRDVSEAFNPHFNIAMQDIPGEFEGTMTVVITYTGPEEGG